MTRLKSSFMAMVFVALPACAQTQLSPATGPSASAAAAEIRNAAGEVVATATARDQSGLTVRVEAARLRPGTYAVHLHAVGRCDAPDFTSAGPHWNPTSNQHGRLNPLGPHFGDLPNIEIGADGRGRIEFAVASGSVRGGEHALLDADGAALVIHANADDYRTDPTGNAGGRMACGVFG